LFSAYLSGNYRLGNERFVLTTWAPRVPLSGTVGNGVVCGFMRAWGNECAELPPGFADLVGPDGYAGPIRYLCRVRTDVAKLECADKNLVGVGVLLLALSAGAIGVIALARIWRLRDRGAIVKLTVRYGIGGLAAASLFGYLAWPRHEHIWIGRMGGIPYLSYTGDMIGWCLLLVLAVMASVITVGGAVRWKRLYSTT
jgi:hypothetical protein